MSSLSVVCPYCQKTLKVPEKMIGREIRCPRCKQGLKLEGAGGAPADGAGQGGVDFGSLAQDTARGSRPSAFWELLTFRRMIAPVVLQLAFWILVVLTLAAGGLTVSAGVMALLQSNAAPEARPPAGPGTEPPFDLGLGGSLGGMVGDGLLIAVGLGQMIVGPLVIRILFEMLIMVFRVYDVLREVRDKLDRQ